MPTKEARHKKWGMILFRWNVWNGQILETESGQLEMGGGKTGEYL
jgi:hypothetical protein